MTYVTRRQLLCRVGRVAGFSLMGAAASEQALAEDCAIKVRMRVPLTIGTVRTPAFKVMHRDYHILLRVAGRQIPTTELSCLLGNSIVAGLGVKCGVGPAIQGNWTVWDGVNKVAEGVVNSKGGSGETIEERELGQFVGQNMRGYVVEVTFTKDGGPLKSLDPQLVIRQDYDFWCSPL